MDKFQKIKKFLQENNYPDYRFQQLLKAVFDQKIKDFKKMTAFPKKLRQQLEKNFSPLIGFKKIKQQKTTRALKTLFQLQDNQKIETVFMRYKNEKTDWNTVCLSTQIGCALGCVFCSTAKMGFKRNLTVDEITDQLLYFILQKKTIHSVSFMGMGEPFLNPDLFESLKNLNNKQTFNLGQRNINISTVGIIPGIKKLSEKFPQVNLAFSLHTPFQEQRKKLMPISKKYPINDVFKALNKYIQKTNRRVFIAYTLLNNINDTQKHLQGLKKLIKSQGKNSYLYHVNLISYNPTIGEKQFQPSSKQVEKIFLEELKRSSISVSKRQTLGQQINAGCGQLYVDDL